MANAKCLQHLEQPTSLQLGSATLHLAVGMFIVSNFGCNDCSLVTNLSTLPIKPNGDVGTQPFQSIQQISIKSRNIPAKTCFRLLPAGSYLYTVFAGASHTYILAQPKKKNTKTHTVFTGKHLTKHEGMPNHQTI